MSEQQLYQGLSSQNLDKFGKGLTAELGALAQGDVYAKRIAAMKKGFRIKSIYDMFYVDYPHMFDDTAMDQLTKVDAPLLATTSGAYQAIHGSEAISWVIQEANAYSLIGMKPWKRGGFRGITASNKTSGGGVAENPAIPDTTMPDLENINVPIKEVATTFNVSSRQLFYSLQEDDVWSEGGNSFEAQRQYHALEFNKLINRMLLTTGDTLAGNNVESIDRAISSNSEMAGSGYTAGDLDIYSLDRDASAVYDSYVSHGSATDRDLTPDLIKDVKENVQPYWGGPGTGKPAGSIENKFWLTGFDTMNRIEKLFESQNTYLNNGLRMDITYNGIKTLPKGADAGFLVNSLYGIPIFVSNDVAKDTISRLYLVDGDHMHMSMGIPTQFFNAGMTKGTPLELGLLQDKGMFYQACELWTDRFNVHGKLRDLQ